MVTCHLVKHQSKGTVMHNDDNHGFVYSGEEEGGGGGAETRTTGLLVGFVYGA